MNEPTYKQLASLPRWAQEHIIRLQKRVYHAEMTLPWSAPGAEWFTLFHPSCSPDGPPSHLFTCSSAGTHPVCSLSKGDFVFVGRSLKTPAT
jgi:hypothetical protein